MQILDARDKIIVKSSVLVSSLKVIGYFISVELSY